MVDSSWWTDWSFLENGVVRQCEKCVICESDCETVWKWVLWVRWCESMKKMWKSFGWRTVHQRPPLRFLSFIHWAGRGGGADRDPHLSLAREHSTQSAQSSKATQLCTLLDVSKIKIGSRSKRKENCNSTNCPDITSLIFSSGHDHGYDNGQSHSDPKNPKDRKTRSEWARKVRQLKILHRFESIVVGSLSIVIGSVVIGSIVIGSVVMGSVVIGSIVIKSVVIKSVVIESVVIGSVVLGYGSVVIYDILERTDGQKCYKRS